MAALSSYYVII